MGYVVYFHAWVIVLKQCEFCQTCLVFTIIFSSGSKNFEFCLQAALLLTVDKGEKKRTGKRSDLF